MVARRSAVAGGGRHADDGTVDLRDSVASPRRRRGRLAERGPAGPGLSAGTAPLIRRFEERILELFKAGCVHGPAHASIGQEGGAVGAMSTLTDVDKINATHRAHHQFLAKFLNHAAPEDYDPREDDWPEAMQEVVHRSMAEIMGLSPGYCGGRGGSMHMRWDQAGVLGTNAIVGGNPPQAVGYALAEKLKRQRQPHRHLLRRRRDAERRGLRIPQHGRALRPADRLLRREQSLWRLHPRLRDHAGDAALGARAGARGALGRGRRHGRDGGAQGDAVGARPDRG